jgi:hypothetical protein
MLSGTFCRAREEEEDGKRNMGSSSTRGADLSSSIQLSDRRLIIHLDPTSLRLVAIPERQLPAALALWCGKPQSHEVSARLGRGVVFVCCASVHDMAVGEELDVSDFENHVQSKLEAGRFQHVDGFELCR